MKAAYLQKKRTGDREKIKKEANTHDKQATRRLSFSFYDEETMKKSKQIILDDCDILMELPDIKPARRGGNLRKAHKNHKSSPRISVKKQKQSMLEMEHFFLDQKYDEIDIVPTNASQVDPHFLERLISQVKPARSSASKQSHHGTSKNKAKYRTCSTPKSIPHKVRPETPKSK